MKAWKISKLIKTTVLQFMLPALLMVLNLLILVEKLWLHKFIRRWFKMVVFANVQKR